MNRYRCHNIVEATKVCRDHVYADGEWLIMYGENEMDNGSIPFKRVADIPSLVGGYMIRDADGSIAWSSADKFENGYTLVEAQ
jgi:hypothetical protein